MRRVKVTCHFFSHSVVSDSETPWTVAHQALPFLGFPRQEYWSGLPFFSPGDLPNPRIELEFPALQADSLLSEPPGKSINILWWILIIYNKHKS